MCAWFLGVSRAGASLPVNGFVPSVWLCLGFETARTGNQTQDKFWFFFFSCKNHKMLRQKMCAWFLGVSREVLHFRFMVLSNQFGRVWDLKQRELGTRHRTNFWKFFIILRVFHLLHLFHLKTSHKIHSNMEDSTGGDLVKPVETSPDTGEKKFIRPHQARKAGTECCVVGCNNRLEMSSHYWVAFVGNLITQNCRFNPRCRWTACGSYS